MHFKEHDWLWWCWFLFLHVFLFYSFQGGWENMWVEGRTLWDLGEATPIVVHLCETGSLPNGRALVPGCGTVSRFDISSPFVVRWCLLRFSSSEKRFFGQGYDVVVMANPDRHVIGLELSKTSVERSTKVRVYI